MSRYSAVLLAHFNNPHGAQEMAEPTVTGEASLGGCAPRLKLFLRIENDRVQEASFQTFGCGVMVASGSVLTQRLVGIGLDECLELDAKVVSEALGGIPPDKEFCAQVAVDALKDALTKLPGKTAELRK